MDDSHNTTLFVRSLPFNTTNKSLEDVFSEIGPIKKCFVVKDKGSEKCKGFGYVQFAVREDAAKAKEEITSFGNRKLIIDYAGRKPDRKERKKRKQLTAECVEEEPRRETKETNSKTEEEQTTEKKSKSEKKFRLIIRNLSFKAEAKDVEEIFKPFGNLREVSVPKTPDGKKRGFGFVQFESSVSAIKAMKLNGSSVHGRPIVLDWAVAKDRYKLSENRQASGKPTADTEEKLATAPGGQKKDGRTGNKARTDEESGDEIDVESDDELGSHDDNTGKDDDEENIYDSDRAYDDSDDNSDIESEHVYDHKANITSATATLKTQQSHANSDKLIFNVQTEKDCDTKFEDSESEPGSEGGDSEESENESDSLESRSEDSGNESQNSESDGEDDELKEYEETKQAQKKKPRKKPSDVVEGRTLFIRNLPYECEDEEVDEEFSKFGELNFAAVVMDRKTEHSKGSAFVQFKKKEDAEACLASSQQGISMRGRRLLVTVAVEKSQAEKLRKEKKEEKEGTDKSGRNLWLAREGLIRQGSQAAQGLSNTDLAKRMKLEAATRQKLKNPNIFVSTTRLSVHNLPLSVTDAQLKSAILKAVGDKQARINECRIMRDMKNVNSQGVGKSRGYAFVNFTRHDHALKALRLLNNSGDVFGEKRRPIVGFSLENRLVLVAKEKRGERSKLKDSVLKSSNKKGVYSGRQKTKKEKKGADDPTVAKPPENMQKGMKALPSHWGPKIRHKNKAQPIKRKKRKQGSQPQQPVEKKQKVRHPSSRREKTDDLDRLVNKYRKTLADAGVAKKISRTKWFDS